MHMKEKNCCRFVLAFVVLFLHVCSCNCFQLGWETWTVLHTWTLGSHRSIHSFTSSTSVSTTLLDNTSTMYRYTNFLDFEHQHAEVIKLYSYNILPVLNYYFGKYLLNLNNILRTALIFITISRERVKKIQW